MLNLVLVFWVNIAYADSLESDFRAIKLGNKFDPAKNGYEIVDEIPAAPGVRVDAFIKFYRGGFVSNGVGMYRGVAISKNQNAVQDNKAECQQNIVVLVEELQEAGIIGWENYWRKDYDVPVYKVIVQDIRLLRITCRVKSGLWMLEFRTWHGHLVLMCLVPACEDTAQPPQSVDQPVQLRGVVGIAPACLRTRPQPYQSPVLWPI